MKNNESDKRKTQRINYFIALSIEDGESNSDPISVETLNLSEAGACIISEEEFEVGSTLILKNILNAPFKKLFSKAKVIWSKSENNRRIHGLKYSSIESTPKYSEFIRSLIKSFAPRVNLLRLILTIGVPAIPTLTLFLNFHNKNKPGASIFTCFIFFVIIERLWETFFTSKEYKSLSSSEDWSITAVSFYYILMLIFVTLEFFLTDASKHYPVSLIGLALYLTSFIIRGWGVISLGDQWAIHATSPSKKSSNKLRLIIKGPYKYVRHPIYLGVILELIAIPIIAQTYLSLLFVTLVNIPLQILRSRLEEINSISMFGSEYIEYMNRVSGFFPKIKPDPN